MSSILFMVGFIIVMPTFLFLFNYQRCAGKTCSFFLDSTDFVKPILCKNYGDDWVIDKKGDSAYRTNTDKVRMVRYPFGWPKALQQVMPGYLYQKGEMEPLDWKTVEIDPKYHVSAREIASLLEPEWLRALLQGVRQSGGGGGLTKQERIFMFVGSGAAVLALILVFIIMTRVGK
jgi:hypothetical protein